MEKVSDEQYYYDSTGTDVDDLIPDHLYSKPIKKRFFLYLISKTFISSTEEY